MSCYWNASASDSPRRGFLRTRSWKLPTEDDTQIFIALATRIVFGTCSGGRLKPLPILRQLELTLLLPLQLTLKFALPGGLLKSPLL